MKTKDNKIHIGIYGRRNNGKSSIINALAQQNIAIVSDVAGTTTDPVKKSFEILDFAPVILIDTAGIDDKGYLGDMRIAKSYETITSIDLGIIVITNNTFSDYEKSLVDKFDYYKTPFLVIHNKSDECGLNTDFKNDIESIYKTVVVEYSALKPDNDALVEAIKRTAPDASKVEPSVIGDIINTDDIVVLICPIDSEAPTGRMILPQVQLIRDILDNNCISVVLQPSQVNSYFKSTVVDPKLVITDSQIFKEADSLIPKNIPLTSFSTVLARHKGNFNEYLNGTPYIDELKDNDRVLILEACSHHISCEDIGRNKLPNWLIKYTGKNIICDVVAGLSAVDRPITDYALILHCGGCMITKKQLANRLLPAIKAGVPVSNYGMAIAYMHGIFDRAVAPFR